MYTVNISKSIKVVGNDAGAFVLRRAAKSDRSAHGTNVWSFTVGEGGGPTAETARAEAENFAETLAVVRPRKA